MNKVVEGKEVGIVVGGNEVTEGRKLAEEHLNGRKEGITHSTHCISANLELSTIDIGECNLHHDSCRNPLNQLATEHHQPIPQ